VDKEPIPERGPVAISAKGVSCSVAVPIAVTAAKRGYGKSRIAGWRCTHGSKVIVPGQLGNEVGICKKGRMTIKFGWGALGSQPCRIRGLPVTLIIARMDSAHSDTPRAVTACR